jgi:transcriptional regulator with XRE-family HTH domain
MKQIELSEKAGCSRATISRILKGTRKPSVRLAERLAGAVRGTDILDWLYCDKNQNKIVRAIEKAR